MIQISRNRQICQIFNRAFLGCIDASDSESRLILQHFSRSTVAPIGRKKKVQALFLSRKEIHLAESHHSAYFSSPEKKDTFGGEPPSSVGRLGRPRGPPRAPWWLPTLYYWSTLGQPWVNLGSTFGQPWVNLRSTFGQPRVNLR